MQCDENYRSIDFNAMLLKENVSKYSVRYTQR